MTLWHEFREVAARGGRLGKGITVVAKLLAFAGFLPLCVFLLTIPPPSLSLPWYNWLVEFVARHTGGARETVAVVIWRLAWAVLAVGAVGLVKEAWDEWEYSRKALVGALAAAVAVIGLIAVGVVWWRFGSPLAWVQHPAPAGRYPVRAIPQSAWVPTPATLSDAFVIMIVALFGLFRMAGQNRMGNERPGVLAARRAGLGAACLAVLALVIVSSARDVGGFARLLQFAEQLFSTPQSWTMLATLGGLLALLVIGGVCLAVAFASSFVRDGMQLAKSFAWFAAAAGLWALGCVPAAGFRVVRCARPAGRAAHLQLRCAVLVLVHGDGKRRHLPAHARHLQRS